MISLLNIKRLDIANHGRRNIVTITTYCIDEYWNYTNMLRKNKHSIESLNEQRFMLTLLENTKKGYVYALVYAMLTFIVKRLKQDVNTSLPKSNQTMWWFLLSQITSGHHSMYALWSKIFIVMGMSNGIW